MIKLVTIPDKAKEYQKYMVFVITVIWTVVIGVIVSLGFIFFPDIWQRYLTFLFVSILIGFASLLLIRNGHVKSASWFLPIVLWIFITIPCNSAGGILAPGIMTQMSLILTAGLLLGFRGGLFIGLLTISTDFYFVYAEINGFLPEPTVMHTPMTRWISNIIPFGTILALQYYSTNHLRSSLVATQREVALREEAERVLKQTVDNLKERVKEQKTLYRLSQVLRNEEVGIPELTKQIVETLPAGWQFPDYLKARVRIDEIEFSSSGFEESEQRQYVKLNTSSGTTVVIEVVYASGVPCKDPQLFLKEEEHLIKMCAEMIKISMDSRENKKELEEYKYALDIGSIVSIADVNGIMTFVNDNFCKISKYEEHELIGKHYGIISSENHSDDFFKGLANEMKKGKPYRGEFCNRAKDGSVYWVNTSIVPFLDQNGKIYQYLSINHDITDRKNADEKIKESEKLLKKITSQVPGNTYMFEIEESGKANLLFVSRGTDLFNHQYSLEELNEHPERLQEVLFEEDKEKFNDAMIDAHKTRLPINFQYRIVINGHIRWRWMQAIPEVDTKGRVLWYGATSDITPLVDYITSIEQIIFDISHVLRRPVASMKGMSKLVLESKLNESEIKAFSEKLHLISEEMDAFLRELNEMYLKKKEENELKLEIDNGIDNRSSLFNRFQE
ncbi:MAG TPA: PAS domain-containing protein [Flavobacteriales bacterium]|nr:PAS domain-containing protein [Flavobacteriales bacterium]HRJ39517.1 PAS domain-containing protein [Flavobacteriales bacterium]